MYGASAIYQLPLTLKRHFVGSYKFPLRTYMILSLGLVAFLIGFYIFQQTQYTQTAFAVAHYEQQIEEIKKESKNLEINFSETNSLANLESLLKSMNYEEVGQISYIRVVGTEVAAKAK